MNKKAIVKQPTIPMAKQLQGLQKTLKEYSGTFLNSAVIATTGGIEQLISATAFYCPCVSSAELGNGCNNVSVGDGNCSQLLNYGYGLSFIIAPALVLYIFGVVSSPRVWKSLTGCKHKTQKHKREANEAAWTMCSIAGSSLLSPFTWICVAFLDGSYFACSLTAQPYDVERTGATYTDCETVAAARTRSMSDAFQDNRSFSQLLGWIITTIAVAVGITIYCITQCTFPLTYYHAKYYKLYREIEEAEFEDEMTKKAKVDAEANVLKFMGMRRDKELWDKISTVYEFHRDKNNLALYSHLHEWVIQTNEDEEKNQEMETLLNEDCNSPDENGPPPSATLNV